MLSCRVVEILDALRYVGRLSSESFGVCGVQACKGLVGALGRL